MLAIAGTAMSIPRGEDEPRAFADDGVPPAHPSLERDGLRWEYDAMIDRERLLDVSRPGERPADVTKERADLVPTFRAEALRRLGIADLATIREAHREAAEALHALGYL